MRASESLSLTSQADAAFLARLATMTLGEARKECDPRQLARTLKTIRQAFVASHEAKARAARAEAEAGRVAEVAA